MIIKGFDMFYAYNKDGSVLEYTKRPERDFDCRAWVADRVNVIPVNRIKASQLGVGWKNSLHEMVDGKLVRLLPQKGERIIVKVDESEIGCTHIFKKWNKAGLIVCMDTKTKFFMFEFMPAAPTEDDICEAYIANKIHKYDKAASKRYLEIVKSQPRLSFGFCWGFTKEGHEYWARIARALTVDRRTETPTAVDMNHAFLANKIYNYDKAAAEKYLKVGGKPCSLERAYWDHLSRVILVDERKSKPSELDIKMAYIANIMYSRGFTGSAEYFLIKAPKLNTWNPAAAPNKMFYWAVTPQGYNHWCHIFTEVIGRNA
jgi:hypothetical protein